METVSGRIEMGMVAHEKGPAASLRGRPFGAPGRRSSNLGMRQRP